MRTNKKLVVKYCSFNLITREFYLCTSKTDLANHINTSTRTILRRQSCSNDFVINDWCISIEVEVHKQPMRNDNPCFH